MRRANEKGALPEGGGFDTLLTLLTQATLTADAPATAWSNDDLRLLRASISAMRRGSPDDTHMAVRYAQFLEILLDASSPRRPTAPAHPRSGLGPIDAGGRGDVAPYMASLDEFDLPDIVSGLGNIGELIDLSDGPYGVFSVMGLL